ncbi:HSF-type DNA-binding domain-containing protein [Plasmodiophora brassicae]|uniref:HSF-type DNA-binding domain-containing protein n=1 Tax=Plasmodiophora brassicae TaxID=37360 RepID=A0A0G4IXD0_PLABS|nr:hypothetical protein PBRA_007429 [Plasmodiophora brassicae]SPQ97977.1 unnamed protein product [Plasmodiophora brassicae]
MDEPSSAFIQKTYTMASSPDDDTIVWSDDGQAILVLDIARLERETLPKYFRHNQFKSFVRQLHGYGFSKTTLRNGDSEFRHPLFVRGRPDLLKQIGRKAADAQEEQKQRTRAMEEQMRWLVEENERLHSIVRLLFEDHAILSARIRMYEPDDVMSAPAAAASAYYHGSQQGQPAMGSASPGRDAMRAASADRDGMRSMPLCYEQQQQQQQVEPAFGTSRSNFVLPRYDSQQMQPAAGSPVPNRDGMPSRSSSTTTDETAAGASGGGIEPGAGVPPASSGGSAIPPDGRDVTHRQANPIARRFTPYIINK